MRQVRHRYATSLLVASLVGLASPAASLAQRVVNIAFDPPPQPAVPLSIHEGDTYNAAAVRKSIEDLFATGRYSDIQVDSTNVEGGIELRFLTKNSWFIGHVGVESDFAEPPSPGQIISSARLELGTPFDEAQVIAAEENIRRLLASDGYSDSGVAHRLDYDNAFQQVRITFVIETGKRATYQKPAVTGDTTVLTEKQIDSATKWHKLLLPGYRGITQTRTRNGIDRVRLKYQNSDRLLATVTLDHLNPPAITVKPGPVVDVTASGAKVGRKQLKQHVPVFEEHTVDADLLSEGAQNLRDYFQARGYFEAGVDYRRTDEVDGKTVIEYLISLGRQHRFVKLDINGNKFFDQKTIRERMFLTPRSFESRRGRYSEAFERRDRETLEDLYRANGFRDVQVTSKVADNYRGKEGDIAVSFDIAEGPRYTVSSLLVFGTEKLNIDDTLQSLSSQRGQIFSEFNVAADRETVVRKYGENGFASTTFEWDAKPGAEPHTMDLRFTIHEGEQQFVRQIVATGLSTTKASLVNQQFSLNPGDPLSPSAMADTQRRLYDLGIFAQVNMAIQNADGVEDRKYILYDLEEARRYSITGGFGAEFARIGGANAVTDLSDPGGSPGVSPRVSLAITRLNFLGAGQTISFQSRLSTLQKRAAVSYFVPRLFDRPKLDANVSILYDDTSNTGTFRARRAEATAQLVQRRTKALTIFYRFNYRDVHVSNLNIDPLLLPRLAQSVRVGIASFNFVQDRRDDPTDPHKGVYNTLDLGVASRIFGSQTSFVRVLARNATYHRLGQKIILARETQFGVQPAFSIPANLDTTDPIPLPERFFGGGGGTQRGFPENQAGPRDTTTGFPLGGSALFFNNTELRFPLFGANVNGVLFEDAGNIYSSLSQMSIRVTQRDITDFNYMVHAAGFGVRYRTPVGPLRFDLAYSVNPPKYNGFPGSYADLVQCSTTRTCQASGQQISHFQFFFSIGQAF